MTTTSDRLTDGERWQRNAAVRALESSFQTDRELSVADCLPTGGTDLLRKEALIALISVDLELRLSRGERPQVEEYLRAWPELADDDDAVFELVQAECEARDDAGVPVGRGGLVSRFPQFRDRLDELLPERDGSLRGDAHETPPPSGVQAETDFGDGSAFRTTDLLPGESLEGRLLGRYVIRNLIGSGGMGCVYVAHDPQIGRDIALKIPKPELMQNPEARTRFFREASTAGAIGHRGVVKVYDTGETDGICWITMELIDGIALSEWMREKQHSSEETAGLMLQAAEALSAVHAAEIVHRDIKSSNIMLNSRGEVVLMDFGLARDEADESRLTGSAFPGTAAYLPPERVQIDPLDFDAQGDVYSLGVVFYELLTGRVPFAGPVAEVLHAIGQEDPTPPAELRPEIPVALSDVCLRAMARSRSTRFQSASELAQSIEAAMAGESVETAGSATEISEPPVEQKRVPSSLTNRLADVRSWASRMPTPGWIVLGLLLIVQLFAVGDIAGILDGALAETGGLLSFLAFIAVLIGWCCVAGVARWLTPESKLDAGCFRTQPLAAVFGTLTLLTAIQVEHWTSFDFDRLWRYGYDRTRERHNEFISAVPGQDTAQTGLVLAAEWAGKFDRTLGAKEGQGVIQDLTVDGSGNMIAVGGIGLTKIGYTSSGTANMLVGKWSPDGTLLWQHEIGGPGEDGAIAVAVDDDGNILIAGMFQDTVDFDPGSGEFPLVALPVSPNGSAFGLFLLKLDPDGQFLWAKPFVSGLAVWKRVADMAIDAAGGIILCGEIHGPVDFHPGGPGGELSPVGNQDSFLARFDADGVYEWSRAYGGARGDGFNDYSNAVAVDLDGNVYLAGRFYDTADFDRDSDQAGADILTAVSDGDVFLLSTDAAGRFRWVRRLGSNLEGIKNEGGNEIPQDVIATGHGTVVVVGEFHGADFDPGNGEPAWSSLEGKDGFISEFDTASGNVVWSSSIGNSGDDRCRAVASAADGALYVAGYYNMELHVHTAAGLRVFPDTRRAAVSDLGHLFVARFDASREVTCVMGFGTGHGDDVSALRLNPNSDVLISGYSSGRGPLRTSAGGPVLSSVGVRDGFLIRTVTKSNEERDP